MSISWLVALTLGITLVVHSLLIYLKLLKPLSQQNLLGWIQIALLYLTQVGLLLGFSTGQAANAIYFALAASVTVILLELLKWHSQPFRANPEQVLHALLAKHEIDLQTRSEPIAALTSAIATLREMRPETAELYTAYQQLAEGDIPPALHIFQALIEEYTQPLDQSSPSANDLATAHTHVAALLFLTDKATALSHYQQAVTLAPENPQFWSRLADVAQRLGRLDLAVEAYQHTLNLAERFDDKALITATCGHLGLIYKLRDEFELAEQMLKRALAL